MPRNVFHRDFTLYKAALLAGLLGIAALLGEVPQGGQALASDEPLQEAHSMIPVVGTAAGKDCDTDWSGKAI